MEGDGWREGEGKEEEEEERGCVGERRRERM